MLRVELSRKSCQQSYVPDRPQYLLSLLKRGLSSNNSTDVLFTVFGVCNLFRWVRGRAFLAVKEVAEILLDTCGRLILEKKYRHACCQLLFNFCVHLSAKLTELRTQLVMVMYEQLGSCQAYPSSTGASFNDNAETIIR